jgi:hypothetical protein
MATIGKRLIVVCSLLFGFHAVTAGGCDDSLLLDASLGIKSFGYDTTGNWWAIAEIGSAASILVVNGTHYGPFDSITKPVFTADGSNFFAAAVRTQILTVVQKNASPLPLDGLLTSIAVSAVGSQWCAVTAVGSEYTLTTESTRYTTNVLPQQVKVDQSGTVSWVEQRGNQQCLMVMNDIVLCADIITNAGFWYDGLPVYAAQNAQNVGVYIGQQLLSTSALVLGLTVQPLGNACAWIAKRSNGNPQVLMYAPDMISPWESVPSESITGMVLSPTDALVAFKNIRNGRQLVNYNNAEYSAGTTTSPLAFSAGGEHMVYCSLDPDAAVVVNGKRTYIRGGVNVSEPPCITASGTTMAWSSATTMVMVDLTTQTLVMGKMCDSIGPTMYNRTTKTFHALGVFGGRLFDVFCKPIGEP